MKIRLLLAASALVCAPAAAVSAQSSMSPSMGKSHTAHKSTSVRKHATTKAMKKDAMKGDAMKGDAMKKDAMKKDAMTKKPE